MQTRSRGKSNLHIPQTPPSGLSREFDFEPILDLSSRPDFSSALQVHEPVQHLSLARNGLLQLPPLPDTLVVLNLAANSLTNADLLALPLLRLLNLSHNRLTVLQLPQSLLRLEELLAGNNSIQRLGSAQQLTALRLIDLANNLLSTVAALEPLCEVLSLRVLRLDGNAVQERPTFEREVKLLLPQVEQLRVPSVRQCSAFAYLDDLPFFPLEEGESPRVRRITSDPGGSREEARSEGRRSSQPFTLRS